MASKAAGTQKASRQPKRPLGRPVKETRGTVSGVQVDPDGGIELVAQVTEGPARLEDRPIILDISDTELRQIAAAYGGIVNEDTSVENAVLVFATGDVGMQKYIVHSPSCRKRAIFGKTKPRQISASSRVDVITEIFPPQTFGYDESSGDDIEEWSEDVIFDGCLSDLP